MTETNESNDHIRKWNPSTGGPVADSRTTRWLNDRPEVARIRVMVPIVVTLTDSAGHTMQVATNRQEFVEWQPGEVVEVPRHLDMSIHIVHQCGHGGRCAAVGCCQDLDNAPTTAVVAGGLAPLLRRIPQAYGVDDPLKAHLSPTAAAARVAATGAAIEDPAAERARARKAGAP